MRSLLLKVGQDEGKGIEVINQLLEFKGVVNKNTFTGHEDVAGYFVNGENIIDSYEYLIDQSSYYKIMTLEEFQTKFPFKPGDLVTIKDKDNSPVPVHTYTIKEGLLWDSEAEEVTYQLIHSDLSFTALANASVLARYDQEKEVPTREEHSFDLSEPNLSESPSSIELKIPRGYTFDQIKDDKVILKKKFPNDYIECCRILGCSWEQGITVKGVTEEEKELSKCLIILKRCRDAYWKLSEGWKEMRLEDVTHYVIYSTAAGKIVNAKTDGISKFFLDFPTEEMRDMFYQSFKDIIEICREFL